MYSIQATNQFKKDFKLCSKRGLNIDLLTEIVISLEKSGSTSKAQTSFVNWKL